jgi:hypothetical protein
MADLFWGRAVGRATFNAVQDTVSGAGWPPVRLVTVTGVLGQEPWALSHRRRYTSVSGTAEALVKETDSCPVQVPPVASLVRVIR